MRQFMIQKESGQLMTSQTFQMKISDYLEMKRKSRLSQEVSHVKPSQSQENVEDLTTLEEHYSSRLPDSPNKSNHAFYCLRTLKGYYHTTREKHLPLSSTRWMNSGMMQNGKCLTVKTLEPLKTERESVHCRTS